MSGARHLAALRARRHDSLAATGRHPRTRAASTKLPADVVTALSLANNGNLDSMARGDGSTTLLWQMMGGVLTFQRIAQVLGQGAAEMARQADLMHSLLDRYQRTGRVGFSGPEYQLAKEGVLVMDLLAAETDQATAIAAAAWSEAQIRAMVDAGRQAAALAEQRT